MAVALTAGTVHAQNPQNLQPVALNADAASAANTGAAENDSEVQLLVGRSTLLNMGASITRVSLTSPNVADAMVTTPSQLLIHGKAPGTISMFVWDRTGAIKRYEVVVRRDLSQLVDQVQQLFPGEPISVHSNGKDVVISGVVSSKYVVDKAAEVAAGYVEKKEDVVNLLRQQEGVASNQVLLRVRFAEVSRTAMTELGGSLIANGFKDGRWFGRTSTQQFAAPAFDSGSSGGLVFSDFLNLFIYDNKNNLGAVVKALQTKGLFQSLAEPNLIAENGKEASFLAGGEYPYPVVQGQSGGQTVTIQFKEFGVRLHFTPTIVGSDLVKLKVAPEVSSLDFGNAVSISGFRVPAITTRRTETEVELQDGQTFAIAGLLNNTVTSQLQKIPGIGDIPILGYLFKSKAAQKDQTELVVMITPTILRRGSTGVSPKLPDLIEPYLPPVKKTLPAPAPWNPGASGQASMQPAPAPAPATTQPAPSSQPAYVQTPQPTPADVAPATPAPVSVAPPPSHAQSQTADARSGKPTKSQKQALEQARKQDEAVRKQQAKQAEQDKVKAAQIAKLEAEQAE
ncbi:MAG TPA: pilus assembly protein N-terminal domain-containing protein, partial [Chloroflexota bacterium]|nr:pilus assembly protein N-terminal domain-containing protein [Chloroflexota bacterium]